MPKQTDQHSGDFSLLLGDLRQSTGFSYQGSHNLTYPSQDPVRISIAPSPIIPPTESTELIMDSWAFILDKVFRLYKSYIIKSPLESPRYKHGNYTSW